MRVTTSATTEPLRRARSAPLRIVHVLAPAQFGGLERVVCALAGGHRRRGHEVAVAAVLARGSPESPLLDELRTDDVGVHPIVFHPRAYRAQLRAVRTVCAALEPDVVHSHGYLPDVLVALSKGRRFPPIATTVHGFTGGDAKIRFYEWLQVRSHRRFDAVVAVSNAIQDRLTRGGVTPSRIHVIRNASTGGSPIDSAPIARGTLDVPDGVFSIGWVGRVSHEKGLDVLIRALPALSDLPARVTVLGDGRERTHLEALARALGVSDRVHWAGVVPDARRLYRGFDVLVLSSRTEGTPITLFEAMRAGVPVVAAAVGGVPDVVSPEEAVLVAPDDPAALGSAIRGVFLYPSAAGERAARARSRLDSVFSLDPWLDAYERIYRDGRFSHARNAG